MHHLRKNQYPSAPKRSHHKASPSNVVPRNNQLIRGKEFIPTARPQPLPVGSPPPFRFLELPPEVRNLVYSFCLPEEGRELNVESLWTRKPSADSAKGLMGVCKQIRDEFRPMYWSVHGPILQRYQLSDFLKVFFSEHVTGEIVPARASVMYCDHIPGTSKIPGDIVYDLLPLAKAKYKIKNWQVITAPINTERAWQVAQGHWWSCRGVEITQTFGAMIKADWHGMLADTQNMTLEVVRLLHSVHRRRNICSIKLHTPNDSVTGQEQDALVMFIAAMTNAMGLPNIPFHQRRRILVKMEIFNADKKRVWCFNHLR